VLCYDKDKGHRRVGGKSRKIYYDRRDVELLEEREVRPTSIDVRQMNRFRQEKYLLQNGKKKKRKNRIEE
jgi:hypothetical protein